MKNYSYPLELDWTTDEMIDVTNLWVVVEKSYESCVDIADFLQKYQQFKRVVPSIGEEKRLSNQFQQVSGYSLYHAVQEARKKQSGHLQLGGK